MPLLQYLTAHPLKMSVYLALYLYALLLLPRRQSWRFTGTGSGLAGNVRIEHRELEK
jgi:hypothetical protein